HGPFRALGDLLPLVTDGTVQTYQLSLDQHRLSLVHSYRNYQMQSWEGPWTHLGIWFNSQENEEAVTLDILSVSVIPREAPYADAPVGVRNEIRDKIYKRTIFTHTPVRLEYRLHAPQAGRLDVGLGVLKEDAPVTFRITATPKGGDVITLLEETYTDREHWGQRCVDLSALSGKTITLSLEADAERAGTVAFWAGPTISGTRKSYGLTLGTWGPILQLETHPVGMVVLPSGKVLMLPWAPERFDPPHGPIALWDPATGGSITYPGSGIEPGGGLAFQPDGILLMAGGSAPGGGYDGLPQAWTFDYVSETFTTVAPMAEGRLFPGATTLGNGEIIVTAGWDEQRDTTVGWVELMDEQRDISGTPELWDGLAWIQLPAAYNTESRGATYQFLAPDGRLFRAGPEELTDWLEISTETWTDVSNTARNEVRHLSTAVMYDDGKVFILGGCPRYDCYEEPPVATAEVIDLNAPSPAWRDVSPAAFARHSHHATLLPDGTILITGGTSETGPNHEEVDGVLEAELWDPVTETFTTLAAMDEAHHHMSSAVLLMDGTVLVAGGAFGPTDVQSYFSWSGQIFYPPYLDGGPRPTIGSAPSSIQYGSNFTVETPDAGSIANVNLISLSANYETWNGSQRMARLSFSQGSGDLSVSAPSDPNLAPPGFYLLFILSDAGVPSVASMVQLVASAPENYRAWSEKMDPD
ncbi:MAG: DUF1929 domain-containing protein, partial [Planctomycetes bacterium]|nr:DUF1929 domain-containing protein [Planctomycetota bacterium]